jgi:hypothetical protein
VNLEAVGAVEKLADDILNRRRRMNIKVCTPMLLCMALFRARRRRLTVYVSRRWLTPMRSAR